MITIIVALSHDQRILEPDLTTRYSVVLWQLGLPSDSCQRIRSKPRIIGSSRRQNFQPGISMHTARRKMECGGQGFDIRAASNSFVFYLQFR